MPPAKFSLIVKASSVPTVWNLEGTLEERLLGYGSASSHLCSTLLSHLPFFLCSMPFLSFSGVLTGLDVLMCVTLKRRKRLPNRQMSESPASVTVCSQVRLRSSSYCSRSSNWYCLQTYNFNVTTGSLDTRGQSLYREKLGCPR